MENIAFIILLIVWIGIYIAGMLMRREQSGGTKRIPWWTKIGMITVTLVLAVIGWLATGSSTFALFILLGLAAGAVGDLILADFVEVYRAELIAMATFGIGHGFYILAIFTIRRALDVQSPTLFFGAIAGSILVGIVGWRALVFNPIGSHELNIGSLMYGLLLIVTVGLAGALALASERPGAIMFAAGIGIFAVSDIILAQALIRKRQVPLLRDVVWLIYSTGQVLIALSISVIGPLA